jgi:hypothetical protein
MNCIRSIEDINNNLVLPTTVFCLKKPFTGESFVMNGYNGYTSTPNDGFLYDVETREPLTDKNGLFLVAKGRRNVHFMFEEGVRKK